MKLEIIPTNEIIYDLAPPLIAYPFRADIFSFKKLKIYQGIRGLSVPREEAAVHAFFEDPYFDESHRTISNDCKSYIEKELLEKEHKIYRSFYVVWDCIHSSLLFPDGRVIRKDHIPDEILRSLS